MSKILLDMPFTSQHTICSLLLSKYVEFKLQDSKKKTSCFEFYLTPGMNMKIPKPYCASTCTSYAQSYSRVFFVSAFKCRWSSSENHYMTENAIVRPSYDIRGKMKISNPFCIFAIYAQTYPRVSIVYFWECIISSNSTPI